MTGAAAEAHDVWAKAREDNDFALFLPHLERAVELKRRYIDCFEGYDEPYDVAPRRLRAGDEDGRGARRSSTTSRRSSYR